MHKVNKILILFLSVIAVSFVGVWQFVQSEKFGSVLSKSITDYSKKIGTNIEFDKVEFTFFPPSATVKNVTLRLSQDEYTLDIGTRSLGIFFSISDSFKTDLTVQKIQISDAKIVMNSSNIKSEKNSKVDLKKSISQVFDVLNNKLTFKVSKFEVLDTYVEINNNQINVKNAEVGYDKKINLKLTISDYDFYNKFSKDLFDELSLNLSLSSEMIDVHNVEVKRKLSRIISSGEVYLNSNIDKIKFKINSKAMLDVSDAHDFVDMSSVGKLSQGVASVNCNSFGLLYEVETNCFANVENLDSSFVYAQSLDLEFNFNLDRFLIKGFKLNHNDQSLTLLSPFVLYSLKSNTFIDDEVRLEAKNLNFDNALKYLQDSLSPLKGSLSGKVNFILGKNDFHFLVSEGITINDLKVQTGTSNPIISIEKLKIDKGSFDVVGNDFSMNVIGLINQTSFEATGNVANGSLDFNIDNGYFNFSEFGKFAGFQVQGKGTSTIKVSGPFSDVKIDLDADLKNFTFEGYELDKVLAQVRFDILTSSIVFKNVRAITGTSILSSSGVLNYNNLEVDVVVDHEKINIVDLHKIYSPLLNDFQSYTKDIYGQFIASLSITGKATLDDLKINSTIKGKNIFVFGESVEKLSFNFDLVKKILFFKNIELQKVQGKVFSSITVNLDTSEILVNGNIFNVSIEDFQNYPKLPIDFTSNLNASFGLKFKDGLEEIKLQSYLNKSLVSERKLEDSYFSLSYLKNILFLEGNIFGDSLKFVTKLDLNETKDENKKLSNLMFSTQIKDLSLILSSLRGIDLVEEGLKSDIRINSNINFNYSNLATFDGDLSVDKFYLLKDEIQVNYSQVQKNNIQVSNGKVNNWDLDIKGKKFYLLSKASGDFSRNYDLRTKVKIDASIAEVFNKLISKSSGDLIAQLRSYKIGKNEKSDLSFLINNLSLTSNNLPTAISDSDIRMTFIDKRLVFERFNANLSKGNIRLDGDINFNKIIPQINLNYFVKNAGLTILDKSSVIVSGQGSLIGENIPYTLTGEFLVNKGNIINEISDFGDSNDIVKQEIKYLPLNKQNIDNQFLNLNISINTTEPIRVVNSRMDLGLEGAVQLIGGESNPKLAGKISLASISNKVYFQNNEYRLSKGNIFFYQNDLPTNPELDFLASSNIANNLIDIRVYGRLSDYKINLTSEPALSQESILSLIAFGYSEDIAGDLSDSEKESITRAGVGSILFDSFKINETLKNEFGLQIDLGTQISKDEGSYLTHRNTDTNSTLGRVRSATTIEIKKKINDAMSMSMTSTVGSSSGQRQLMNLNYNINKTYSVEGVFEKRTSVDGDQDNVDNSFGADLKMKWSFK